MLANDGNIRRGNYVVSRETAMTDETITFIAYHRNGPGARLRGYPCWVGDWFCLVAGATDLSSEPYHYNWSAYHFATGLCCTGGFMWGSLERARRIVAGGSSDAQWYRASFGRVAKHAEQQGIPTVNFQSPDDKAVWALARLLSV